MSGLAEILLREGFTVTGSDAHRSAITDALEQKGAKIQYQQVASNIQDSMDCVVYTAAISRTNGELIEAIARRIPLLTRAELLGQLMLNYKTPIAVSGTHGKTTTTSLISHVLLAGNLDPTISVGGILGEIGGNIRVGGSDTFITEACEYTNSFLDFHPKISIILNIEEDHLDFFQDIEDIRNSFRQFVARLPEDGTVIINGEIDQYEEIYQGIPCHVITYGPSLAYDYSYDHITYDDKGRVSFDLFIKGVYIDRIDLSVTGRHNASNALSAIAAGQLLGLDLNIIKQGLQKFVGTNRRFEYKGMMGGVTIVDDYAHHPTEIDATISAASHYPHRELWCVFQPHTYTRTKVFFQEFAKALSGVDHLILTDIYAAREHDDLGVSSEMLAHEVKNYGTDVVYMQDFQKIANYLRQFCRDGDLLITMGAGNVVDIAELLLE